MKYHGILVISSKLAFLLVYIASWLAVIVLIVVTASTVRSIVLSATKKLSLPVSSVSLFGGIAVISGIAHVFYLFAIESYCSSHGTSSPITGIELLPSSLLYIGVHSLIAALLLAGYIPGETPVHVKSNIDEGSTRLPNKRGYMELRDQAI